MKFKKQDLIDMAYHDHDESVFEVLERTIIDTSRWSNHYVMIFTFENKTYSTKYSTGATESQDESPYDYEGDEIECEEVEAYEYISIGYRKMP